MPKGSVSESLAIAWWAMGKMAARPHSSGSVVSLLDALAELGLGTFRSVRERLEGESWNHREAQPSGKWVEKLREELAPLAFLEDDPETCWDRRWDQKWRILAFDLPAKPQARRQKLWRWLKQNRLGLLQRSLWISAKPLEELRQRFHEAANSQSLMMWEAPTPTGLSPISIVEQAWDMPGLDAAYQAVLSLSQEDARPENIRKATFRWQKAVQADPLLPRTLYPKSFRGFRATEQLDKMWSKFRGAGS